MAEITVEKSAYIDAMVRMYLHAKKVCHMVTEVTPIGPVLLLAHAVAFEAEIRALAKAIEDVEATGNILNIQNSFFGDGKAGES